MRTEFIIGIDEVGRGPLAGPLCLGVCAVERGKMRLCRRIFRGAKDCKQLSSTEREAWFAALQDAKREGVVRVVTTFVGSKAIDARGMARALRVGVCRVLKKLCIEASACRVLLDGGLKAPALFGEQKTIIRRDETELLIALASIAAKVRRDRHMVRLAKRFSAYGFEVHKGYGTKLHYTRLRQHGMCNIHRKTFIHKGLTTDA